MSERWGVFEVAGEIHVAPCDKKEEGLTNHELQGLSCWCEPRKDTETDIIIHSDVH